jgi:hypothetical protein
MSRQYYGIEDIALTQAQRETLIDALKKIGKPRSLQPAYFNHWRVRNDNKAVIFEGRFDDDEWTVDTVVNRLAHIFNVDPAIISTSVNQTQYGPVVTFSAGGTDRMRMIAFGGLLATWEESHDLVSQYLAANSGDWSGE